MEDRRKSDRKKTQLPSDIETDTGVLYGETVDLSKGGIFISTPDPIGVDSPINLEIQLPGEDVVRIKGKVKWVRNNDIEGERAGMGIEFSSLSESQIEKLKKM